MGIFLEVEHCFSVVQIEGVKVSSCTGLLRGVRVKEGCPLLVRTITKDLYLCCCKEWHRPVHEVEG